MGKRTCFEDIAVIALSYLNESQETKKMLSYDKVKEYDKIINDNLEAMNSQITLPSSFEEGNSFYYFRGEDENNKIYLIINPNVNIKAAMKNILGYLPNEIIVASQKANALKAIGLQIDENGKFTNYKENRKKSFSSIYDAVKIDEDAQWHCPICNAIIYEYEHRCVECNSYIRIPD